MHFLILGLLLFGVDAVLRDRSDNTSRGEIVVTAGRIENLSAVFEKTWQRPPSAAELQNLVNTYILDEALFRHGVSLGMDQDDNVIRRRVRQKVDFLVDNLASPAEPDDAALQSWFDERINRYVIPATFTFYQIYLNPERHGDSLGAEVDRLLAELRSADTNVDFNTLGDATLLDPSYVNYRADLVANGFGGLFASQLEDAPVGEWSGPFESAFGMHLVFMDAMTPARVPDLADVRDAVERDWRHDKREAAVAEFHKQTVAGYEVTIDWPESDDANGETSE